MSENTKICDFKKYCPMCNSHDISETEDPCNTCLSHPANINSEKPWFFKPNDDTKQTNDSQQKHTL